MIASRFFVFLAFVLVPFFGKGQEVTITPISYPLDQFLTNIVGICQDENGFIWLADNYNGLVQYDGTTRKYYRSNPNDSNSLFSNRLESLYAGKGGVIWIGSAENGLDKLDVSTERFTHFQHDPANPASLCNDRIYALMEDRTGTLWVGTEKGLDTLDRKTGDFVHIEDNSPAGRLLADAVVRTLYEDQFGKIWIGAGNAFDPNDYPSSGLYKFEKESGVITHYAHDPRNPNSLIGNRVRAIFEDIRGTFYVGTDGDGLHIMNRAEGTFQRLTYNPGNPNQLSRPPVNPNSVDAVDHITFINEDALGYIWIGTFSGGINRYNPFSKTMEFYGESGTGSHYLEKNEFWTLLKTKDDLLWVSGWEPQSENQVLFQISTFQNQFEHIETGSRVVVFAQGSESGIWIGTERGLVGKDMDDSPDSFFAFVQRELGSKYITDLRFDNQDNLWVATIGGAYFFDRNSKTFEFYNSDQKEKNSLSYFIPSTILPGKDGTVWIGTAAGLDILNMNTGIFSHFKHDPTDPKSLSSNFISNLLQDSKGNRWVGTDKGLNRYDPESGSFKSVLNSSGAAIVNIFEDSKQKIWVSTYRSGLYLYNPESDNFGRYYDSTGLITDLLLIKGIVEDTSKLLWLNTDLGFIRLDPETKNAVLFGLSWKETSENGFNSVKTFFCKKGEVLTGDASGYFHFNPADLDRQYSANPKPYLTALFLGNRQIVFHRDEKILPNHLRETHEIRLQHHQNTFTLEFGTIDFVTPESEENLLYKLDNYDQSWKSGIAKTAGYHNLPPGEYTFHLKASNRYGKVGQRSISILVMRPWFTQWWAWLAYVILLFSVLYGIYGFLLRRKLAQAEVHRLRNLDLVKTRLYTNLTHEFRTPLTVISGITDHLHDHPSDQNLKEGLPMIKRNSRQMLRLINQMLDLSKLESGRLSTKMIHDDILGYLKYLMESFHSFAESKDIRLHVLTSLEKLEMDFDPEKIQAIFSNLLGNSIKFTPVGGDIYVKVEIAESSNEGSFLVLSVKDTGKGIPKEHLADIFDRFYQGDDSSLRRGEGSGIGLALTKELVQLMEGDIKATSHEGKGAEFTIKLPIRREAPRGPAAELVQELLLVDADHVETSTLAAEERHGEKLPLALLIEDNEDVLNYLALCLHRKYRIHFARNGGEGIHLAIELIPDIIVSDVLMPCKDGFEVLETLKNDERTSHIPIILLTAKADLGSRLEGLEHGADAYLAKPFEKEELDATLRNLMELRKRLKTRYRTLVPEGIPANAAEIQEDAFLKKLRQIIESNLDNEEFGITQLCHELGISRTQLHRKLKALTEKSTSQVIRTIRMQEAKKLLKNAGLNISEIGYAVGYGNPSHFTQEFTKEFGEAPSFFRRDPV